MDMFTLSRVKKSYAGRIVLDVESLSIAEGEILALVGPSGAGKSTLLRILNFLETPDQGEIVYRGTPFSEKVFPLEMRREVTTVFQRPALLTNSVEKNVTIGLRLRGETDGRKRIHSILERLGLAKLAHAPAYSLSGGEMQRVALARAIVLNPRVLLLDEPTANLDPYNIGLIEQVAVELNREHGITVVLVTHNIFQAKRIAHRSGLMLSGKIVEIAPTQNFFNHPQDERTLAFVRGEMVY